MITEQDKQTLQTLCAIMQTGLQSHVTEVIEMAELTYEICQKARKVDLTDNLDRNFIDQWVRFYDEPDTFMRSFFAFLAPETDPDTLEMVANVYDREKLAECAQPIMMGMLTGQKTGILENLKEALSESDDSEDELPDMLPEHFFEKCKKEPKMLFYFKVWFPCWIEYCEFLPALMKKAVKGNSDALEKLIRLDPCILNHLQINIEYQKIRLNNKPLFDRLCKAQQGKGLKELTPTNIKYLFGAYVYRLLQFIDSRMQVGASQYKVSFPTLSMSAEEILDLFNQHAKKTSNKLNDRDFESVSAFKAGVSRYKSFWDNSFS